MGRKHDRTSRDRFVTTVCFLSTVFWTNCILLYNINRNRTGGFFFDYVKRVLSYLHIATRRTVVVRVCQTSRNLDLTVEVPNEVRSEVPNEVRLGYERDVERTRRLLLSPQARKNQSKFQTSFAVHRIVNISNFLSVFSFDTVCFFFFFFWKIDRHELILLHWIYDAKYLITF